MKLKNIIVLLYFLSLMMFINVKAEDNSYIYLDLNCDHVIFDANGYSGCIFKTIDGEVVKETITNDHLPTNKYYIYQSNENNKDVTGYINGQIILPKYESMSSYIKENIVNNTNVDEVINLWKNKANSCGRSSTEYRISITGTSIYDIVIDNLWSNYHQYGTSRTTGGISFKTSSSGKTIIRMKGDNRFGNIYYNNSSSNASITFTSFDGDGEETGTVTVANLVENVKNNYWNSAIGGSDNSDAAHNIIINGGIVYAGTTTADNSTAIGGGGNGYGKIKINGGIVTAVSNSTGTAIGGGIGMSSAGGNALVDITGGVVYAYNTGQAYAANVFVPGVAIGGGSSRYSNGNTSTTVNITGGTVYAEALGGVAIGGGSSATKNGGPSIVNISGDAKVTANSVEGKYTYSSKEYVIKAGSGIGGGTGGTTGNGGNAEVTINGGTITSGTIGGGETLSTTGTIGSATVNINGGTVIGRVLMYTGTFLMTNGILTKGDSENGGCLQMYGGDATISGGEIKECNATNNGGAIYLEGGIFNSNGGIIHNNMALNNGGSVYLGGGTFNSNGGTINYNTANNGGAVYISDGTVNIGEGIIEHNKATNGDGGAIYIGGNGNFVITGGKIVHNEASNGNGGGVYLNSGTYTMEKGSINNNTSINGAGAYINSAIFSLTGGEFNNNVATQNGGGFYIGDNSSVELSNGIISGNQAINGGGFYQTQEENATVTNISGNCIITKNNSINGNGGGVYINGGSTFRMIGGKVTYNKALINNKSKSITTAKESVQGVGGGVYILHGIFTMKDDNDLAGNAAIFGNTASFAADDLFASGDNTSFDAIPVIDMIKDGAYLNSTDWFEDYPKDEEHPSLKISDNKALITSAERYSKSTSEEQLVLADSVLSESADYICITMGANVGDLILRIIDENIGTDNIFIYNIRDNNLNVNLNISLKKGNDTKIVNMPIGNYTLTLKDEWSWKYQNQFKSNIIRGDGITPMDKANSIDFVIIGGQTIYIDTSYEIKNKSVFSKNIFTVKGISNGLNLKGIE